MSGHSHWAGIKHQKGIADAKRGRVFSKLLTAITAAARTEPNPDFNPRLRSAIQKAKENKVPAENIDRAIKHASEKGSDFEELVFEAYGPGGIAILIEVVTANKNRIVQEVKKILGDHGAKWADSGSVRWAFETQSGGEAAWRAKFPQAVGDDDKQKLSALAEALRDHEDVHGVYTNAQ